MVGVFGDPAFTKSGYQIH